MKTLKTAVLLFALPLAAMFAFLLFQMHSAKPDTPPAPKAAARPREIGAVQASATLFPGLDESAVTDEKLRLDKCDLVAYSHGHYVTLGKSLGAFGYSVRKKSAKGRKPGRKKS